MSALTIEIIVHHCTMAPCVKRLCPRALASTAASGHAARAAAGTKSESTDDAGSGPIWFSRIQKEGM
eukprot:scaffold69661_cov63-Phaeocystis_antarctica.AAC.2